MRPLTYARPPGRWVRGGGSSSGSACFMFYCIFYFTLDIQNLCRQLLCDETCEVVMTQDNIAVPYCVCDIGFQKVRVRGGTSCSCKFLAV